MEGLERAGEAVKKRDAIAGVGEGVQGSEEEVEADAPICEEGEVAELVLGGSAALFSVDAVPD